MKCNNEQCSNEAPIEKQKHYKSGKEYSIQRTKCYSCQWLYKNYGISTPDRDALLTKQNSKCCICKENISFNNKNCAGKGTAVVDHCHTNKHIRGILCGSCNTLLGKALDSPSILLNATLYLLNNK